MHIINPYEDRASQRLKNRNPTLFLPDGQAVRRMDVTGLSPSEMIFFRDMHRIAQKYHLALICSLCNRPFQGANNGHESYMSIRCGCRELRGERPRDGNRGPW